MLQRADVKGSLKFSWRNRIAQEFPKFKVAGSNPAENAITESSKSRTLGIRLRNAAIGNCFGGYSQGMRVQPPARSITHLTLFVSVSPS